MAASTTKQLITKKLTRVLFLPVLFISIFVVQLILTDTASYAAPVIGFDPTNIIDDGIFTNSGTMSVAQIQAFLNAKVSSCDTNGTQPATDFGRSDLTHAQYAALQGWSAPPYTCLKDYSENNTSSAQIIYNLSQQYQINPQVLLVLLQKEQGLVTDNWPLSTQYRTATGYGCPDTSGCDTTYYGFTNQVTWAAKMFRAILNNSPTWYTPYVLGNNYIQYNPQSSCGGTTVNIQNRSTQALYNYTPYQPNAASLNAGYGSGDSCSSYGNRNFYEYFSDWFGSTHISKLVRTPSSPTYYLLTNGEKFAIANGDILYAYGLQTTPLSVVSDAYLSTITDGGLLSTIFTQPGDGTVYLADGGYKYGISSGTFCTSWGLACGDPNVQKQIGHDVTDLLPPGGNLQAIMKFSNAYYLMQNGKKQQFSSLKSITDHGYTTANVTPIINWTNATRPLDILLPENNSFVKFASGSAIYFYSGGVFFSIPDFTVYTNWLGTNGVSYFDSTSNYNTSLPTTSAEISNLVTNNGVVAAVGIDKEYILPNAAPTVAPFDITSYPQLVSYLSARPTVTVNETNALATPSGTIFGLKQGALRPIPSMQDLGIIYLTSSILSAPSSVVSAYPAGKLLIPAGRLFKPAPNNSIYIYGSDGYSWALGNLNELNSTLQWTKTILNLNYSDTASIGVKIYTDMVSLGSSVYVVMQNGTLTQLPTAIVATNNSILPIDGPIGSQIAINASQVGFLHFDNGTIFKISSTQIQPISTMSTYNSLGGNPTNTIDLPLKALTNFTIGSSI